ncbi:MAG TPA: MFS transporter [Burkholderiaceae bacterium]|nr:MFS transporter [Burkholderiaceae bacterium]
MPLNLASGLSHLGQMGLVYPLLTLWLSSRGVSATQIGVVASGVWIGMLAGGLVAPIALRRHGARTVAIVACLSSAVAALAVPRLPFMSVWTLLPATATFGLACGWRWVGIESWLYAVLPESRRGRLIGIHESVISLAEAVGLALIAAIGVASGLAFVAGAFAAAAAVLPLSAIRQRPPDERREATTPATAVATSQPMWARCVAWGTSVPARVGGAAGIVNASFGMLGVYFVKRGLSAEQAAAVFVMIGLGSLFSQLPLGWYADRYGSRAAALVTGLVGALGGCLLFVAPSLLWLPCALLGAAAASSLTVAGLVAAEHAVRARRSLGQAIAQLSVSFTAGSVLAPLLAGIALEAPGAVAFPWLAVAVSIVFWLTSSEGVGT